MYRPYKFEENSPNRLSINNHKHDKDAFLNNLGLSGLELPANHVVDQFIIHHCGNIEWYQARQKSERKKRRFYNFISVSLLFVVPLAIFLVTDYFASKDANIESISSSIVIILTSLLAVQKTIATWMEKRKLNTLFHASGSSLKSQLFSIEEKWNDGSAIVDRNLEPVTFSEPFLDELQLQTLNARKIVDDEQLAYYELISFPKIDLSGLLSSSKKEAMDLLKSFQSQDYARTIERHIKKRQQEEDTKAWKKNISEIMAKRDFLEKQIQQLKAKWEKSTEQDKKDLEQRIIKYEELLEDNFYDQIESELK